MTVTVRLNYSVAAAVLGIVFTLPSLAAQPNITGIPTYPHDTRGTMDAVFRSVPNGQHCMHYAGDTPDALADVEDWYKKQMPGARTEDINKNSLYGSFKLDGIKLLLGNDIVNIYRMAGQKTTSIEIFKCKDAAHG
jgi:threonine synthase